MASLADHPRRALPLLVGLLAALLVAALYLRVVAPWEERWGATAADLARPLPGDDFVPRPHRVVNHVVAVAAPPDAVWPWLIQLGQDRAGFYSYDWLENLFGAGIHNRELLRPDWQERQVGELVPAVRANYLGGRFEEPLGWKVTIAAPNEALGLAQWGTFALVPEGQGTRLIARQRSPGPAPAVAWPALTFLMDPAHFVMERRMLLGIKALAEGRPLTPPWLHILAAVGWCLGAAALAAFFVRGRHWLSLLLSLGVAGLVLYGSGDPEGALAGFMGLGLALCCAHRFRWWGLAAIVALGVFTYAVLALATEAWVLFGLLFGAGALVAALPARRRRPRGLPLAVAGAR